MKRLLVLLSIISLQLSAQSPSGISYQAVARDNAGSLIANQSVQFRLAIRQGSAFGTFVYQETHAVTTNAFGLANLVIGTGTVNMGSYAGINWAGGPYFLQVDFAVPPGSFQTMGTSQFISVPYALYAEHGGDKPHAGTGITITGDTIHSTWTQTGNNITTNNSGNVGIGANPANQKLEVGGGILIGATTNSAQGSLRYNGSDFEGATGSGWKSLTKSSLEVTEFSNINNNTLTSTARNTMVVMNSDSLIVPSTGNYLIIYSGRGINSNAYDISTGNYDGECVTGILNVTNNLNWVGGASTFFCGQYQVNTSSATYYQYMSHIFSCIAYSSLNAGDVLKAGAVVFSAGTVTTNWTLFPYKIKLIKLN